MFVWSMQTGRLLEVRVRGREGFGGGGCLSGPCRLGDCWR